MARREHELYSHVRELHLTEAGRRVLDAADQEVTALERALQHVLGDDGPVLRELLERVAALPAHRQPVARDAR